MELPFFNIVECLPFDIMHSIFEGVSSLLLNQLFQWLINVKTIVSLDVVNNELQKLCDGYSEIDSKPAPVYRDKSKTNFHFKQKGSLMFLVSIQPPSIEYYFIASQMKTLVRYLPAAIGKFIPEDDDHWACFLLFWEICNLSLAFKITKKLADHMEWLVEAFLESFSSLYSAEVNMTPKLHHLVHFPEQILRFIYGH